MTFSDFVWYCKNILFTVKYKLGLAKPSVDFSDDFSSCFCINMADCPEDCGVCPFYHPEGM